MSLAKPIEAANISLHSGYKFTGQGLTPFHREYPRVPFSQFLLELSSPYLIGRSLNALQRVT